MERFGITRLMAAAAKGDKGTVIKLVNEARQYTNASCHLFNEAELLSDDRSTESVGNFSAMMSMQAILDQGDSRGRTALMKVCAFKLLQV